jgi:hypothetical protein
MWEFPLLGSSKLDGQLESRERTREKIRRKWTRNMEEKIRD